MTTTLLRTMRSQASVHWLSFPALILTELASGDCANQFAPVVLRGAEEEAERLAAFLGCRLSLAWNSLI
ncbi:MAG: hypothetical protein JO356_11545 [Acidobacteria bacterium]|nr:hypothetical protein [Acidobacteriota bacterium]